MLIQEQLFVIHQLFLEPGWLHVELFGQISQLDGWRDLNSLSRACWWSPFPPNSFGLIKNLCQLHSPFLGDYRPPAGGEVYAMSAYPSLHKRGGLSVLSPNWSTYVPAASAAGRLFSAALSGAR